MSLILLGALLFIAGVVFLMWQPLKGRLSGVRRVRPAQHGTTLEPEQPAAGFSFRSTWPGLAMMFAGAVLLLVGRMV